MADPVFFRDAALIFVAALLGGAAAWALRQPLILGYILGGILVSPFTPGPAVAELHTFERLAEVGVILLMFSIGIEFSLRDLLRVRWVALVGGPLGILLSVALGAGAGRVMGWPLLQGAVVGIVVSVASTMVLARLLLDRGELHSRHGRMMIGISLVEDLAVVILTVLLPALGALERGRLLAIGVALGQAAVILVPFAFFAARVMPAVLHRLARTRNTELFLLGALAIAVGAAALTQAAGLSLALGAFLAGLLISESDYAHETLARLLPLRDAFVAVFFVTIGALIDPATVLANARLLVAVIGIVVVGKLVIRAAIVWAFGYSLATALLVGVGLAQIGEFSFILVQVARSAGHVGADVYNVILAASLISILVNAALVRSAPSALARLGLVGGGDARRDRDVGTDAGGHVVLCGFGRVGSAVGGALETFGVPYAVIERDPDIIQGLRQRGVRSVFGDAAREETLAHCGAAHATLAIVALPEIESARLAVRAIRRLNADVPILARAHDPREAERLRTMGATELIQPEVEAAATLIRHALAQLQLPRRRALDYLERFREAMAASASDAGGEGLPVIQEMTVPAGALAGFSLRDAAIRERFGVTVVWIAKPDAEIDNPPADTVMRAGDRVRLFGLRDQIAKFMAEAHRRAS